VRPLGRSVRYWKHLLVGSAKAQWTSDRLAIPPDYGLLGIFGALTFHRQGAWANSSCEHYPLLRRYTPLSGSSWVESTTRRHTVQSLLARAFWRLPQHSCAFGKRDHGDCSWPTVQPLFGHLDAGQGSAMKTLFRFSADGSRPGFSSSREFD